MPASQPLCTRHWRQVPETMRREVFAAYRCSNASYRALEKAAVRAIRDRDHERDRLDALARAEEARHAVQESMLLRPNTGERAPPLFMSKEKE